MSEELKIEVDVRAKDDNARKTLDGLIKEYKDKEFNLDIKFGKSNNFKELNGNIEKLTSDLKVLSNMDFSNLKSIESNLKNINKLFTSETNALDEKIKEYLSLDKEINNALVKMSQVDANNSKEVVNSLNKEIDLMKQKQALVSMSIRSDSGYTDDLRQQIKLQEDLNKAIAQTSKSELKIKNMDKLHSEALKLNKEFDKMVARQNKIDTKIDIDNQNATKKVEEFKTKTLSNLQELERKYKGTQLFDQVSNEVEKFKNELKGLDDYLRSVEKVDMSYLTSEFRRINQELSQTTKDMNHLNKSMKVNFFDDLYDSMRTFTLGNIIGDALQNGVYAIKEAVVGLDSAMRDMMKVAPAGFEGTSEQLKAVKNDAVEVAKAVGKSTEDVIQGMAKALQTGAKSMSDALEIAKSSSTLANVGDISQEQADTYIASIMSAYGGMTNALKPVRENVQGMSQDYNQLTKFMDLANYAGNNFAISTGDVGEALMRSGSVLSGFGVSMQDAVSMIVGANESVQDAEKVGTAIKTMATNLGGLKAASKDGSMEMNRTSKALKTIAGIDIYSDKQKGEIKDMMTILKELNTVWEDLGQDEQLAIAESIAGKNHINTLMAMMGNWDSVLQLQSEYSEGFTIGSAQREQERYLDSIEGKWNTLKESLKGLVTTVISSDMTKGFLDGAISLTEGFTNVFSVLDSINATVPATIGMITALGQSFKVLSGNGSVSIFGSGLVNGIKNINKELKGTTINFSSANNSISKLNTSQSTLSKSTISSGKSFKTYSNSVNSAGQSIIRINRDNSTLVSQQKKVSGSLTTVASGFKNTAVASKLSMVGTTLLNGALIGLASYGIGVAIKAFDNYINRHEIAAEKSRDAIDRINGEKQQYQSQKKSLEDIAEEYDKLASKANKSASELERFNELKNEIAEISPDLVLGYDENNNPILSMTGDVTDLIEELDRAIENKNRLLQSEESNLGVNATEIIKDAVKDMNESMNWMQANLNTGGDLTLNKALSDKNIFGVEQSLKKKTEKIVDALEEQERAYSEKYSKYLESLEEYNAREQEIQKKNLNELFKKDSYKNLEDDLKGAVNSFSSLFDWGEYDLSGQRQMVNGINELTKAVSDGKIDLEDFNNRWQDVNDTFQNTGDLDTYNKSINQLATELEGITGISADKWVEGLSQQFNGLDFASAKLNKFLQSYNKNLDDLRNGDSVAIHLQKQYDELMNFTDLLNSEILTTGKISYEPLLEVKNGDSFKYLPQQIQTLIDSVLSDGEITESEQDILLRLNTIIANEGALSDDVAEQLNRIFTGNATEQDLEIGVKIGDYEIPPELVKILNDEYKDKNIGIDFKVNTEGIDKLEEAEKKQSELDGKETESTHKVETEGTEDLDNAKKSQDEQDGKNTESTHTTNVELDGGEESKDTLDEISEKADEVDNKDVNLSVNNGELQGSVEDFNTLIEYSTKLKDGEYQINFTSNTADAIAQIDNLKLAVNNLSNQFREMPSGTTITIHTALAAQNISGLLVRIEQAKSAINSLQGKTINIVTALAAQNLSGLIVRVNQYKAAIDSVDTKTCVVETAQAAKNLSGLMTRVDQYNGKTIPTKKVDVNTSSAISKLNTLISKINSLPNSKTVKINVSQSGSVSRIADSISNARSVAPMSEGVDEPNKIALLSDNTDVTPIENTSVYDRVRTTSVTNIATGYRDTIDAFKYNIELLKELENRIKMVENSLSSLDEQYKNAVGSEKIKYLQQQNGLYKEQFTLIDDLYYKLYDQRTKLWQELEGLGFDFTADWNISNFEEKMLGMERQAEYLKAKADSASQAVSDYKGEDENTKTGLQAVYDAAKKEADEYNNYLSNCKDLTNEYFDIHLNKLPDANDEWYKLNNQIKETANQIKELNRQQKIFEQQNAIKELDYQYDKLADRLDIIDIKMNNAYGSDKLNLLKEQIRLLSEQSDIQEQIVARYQNMSNVYRNDLAGYGFTFDVQGDVTNIDEVLNSFKNNEDLEIVTKLLDEYIELQRDEIPDAVKEWENLNSAIKDAYKEQLNITKDMEDKITEIYKKQVEDRIKQMKKETEAKIKELDKQKKAYNDYRDSVDYQRDYDDQMDIVSDLEKQIELAKRDTSLSGQKKLQDLMKQLADEQRKLEDLVQSKVDSDINDMFDKESDRLQEENDKAIEDLENQWSDSKIAELVSQALGSGIFTDIEGQVYSLEDALINFAKESGDLFGVLGSTIQDELVGNLNIALDTFKELSDILKDLNVNDIGVNVSRMAVPTVDTYSSRSVSSTVNFNQPLCIIEGNVTEDVMKDLDEKFVEIKDDIVNAIVSEMR